MEFLQIFRLVVIPPPKKTSKSKGVKQVLWPAYSPGDALQKDRSLHIVVQGQEVSRIVSVFPMTCGFGVTGCQISPVFAFLLKYSIQNAKKYFLATSSQLRGYIAKCFRLGPPDLPKFSPRGNACVYTQTKNWDFWAMSMTFELERQKFKTYKFSTAMPIITKFYGIATVNGPSCVVPRLPSTIQDDARRLCWIEL